MPTVIVAAPAAATARTAAAPVRFWAGFVHRQGTAAGVLAIQGADGSLSLVVIRHFHESKPARTTGVAVSYYRDASYCTKRLKQLTELCFRRTEREITHEDFLHAIPSILLLQG
jgi:hypothetical protein